MSTPGTPSRRPTMLWLTCGILLSCVLLLLVGVGALSAVFGPDRVLSVLRPGQTVSPPLISTGVAIAPGQPTLASALPAELATQPASTGVITPTVESGAESGTPAVLAPSAPVTPTVFYANPAAATATALAAMGSPVIPPAAIATGTPAVAEAQAEATSPAAPAASPVSPAASPGTVTRELTEAQLADTFAEKVGDMGVRMTGLSVKVSGKKLRASAESLEYPPFSLGRFNVAGPVVVQKGKLHFVLEESPPDFAFTDYIEPKLDEMLASLTSDLNVTGVEMQEGKLVVTGTKKS